MMDMVSQQLLTRDHLRRQLAARKTPSQRLHDMARLQRMAWDMLRASPAGYDHFLRRNFKARAIPVQGGHAV